MAAITNEKAWKQIWMDRAEKITDIWDIIKAWCGRSAEVVLSLCMFASIIGVLPGVNYWPWVGNIILSTQIIMLDMGGFALNTLAEHAKDHGQDAAAHKAERMATFLIRLVIATLAIITIGQLSPLAGPTIGPVIRQVTGYLETALILVRVVSTVQYIHVIHSLRGSTLNIQPAQDTVNYEELAQAILPHLPNMQGQPIDYHQVASEISPLLEATFRATIVKEIKATVAPVAGPLLEARATSTRPVIEATLEGQKATRARATKRSTGPLSEATQDEARASDEKLEAAYQQLLAEGGRISGRALAPLARINKNTAAKWLRATHPEAVSVQGQQDDEPEATYQGHSVEATLDPFRATSEGQDTGPYPFIESEISEAIGPVEIQ